MITALGAGAMAYLTGIGAILHGCPSNEESLRAHI
jgi:hypothetical protein